MDRAVSKLVGSAVLGIALSTGAVAQIHGTPASATSFTGFSSFRHTPIPASATSLGPAGFSSRFSPGFADGFIPVRGRGRFRLPAHHVGFFPVAVPVGVPVYVETDREADLETERIARTVTPEPQKVEITIVDKRDPKPVAAPEPESAKPVVKAEPSVPEPEPQPTIIVMSDGSRKELRNYAIMGKDLFDLADNKMFRIPLDTVNVDATIAANAANGKQFRLP
jgi:hypothetical protein